MSLGTCILRKAKRVTRKNWFHTRKRREEGEGEEERYHIVRNQVDRCGLSSEGEVEFAVLCIT